MRGYDKRSQGCALRGTVSHRDEASGLLTAAGDAVLVERGFPRLLVLSCPCGCGDEIPINLDPKAGPAWRCFIDRRKGTTLYPSVWRESGCGSHFVLWNGTYHLFGRDSGLDDELGSKSDKRHGDLILAYLKGRPPVPFAAIAEALSLIPWDVLSLCRRMVREGKLLQQMDSEPPAFGLSPHPPSQRLHRESF